MPGSAIELATAYISILPSTSKIAPEITREVGKAEKSVAASGKKAGAGYAAGMGGALGGAASRVFAPLAAAAAGVGIGKFFGDAIKSASDLEQSVGAVEAVFKGQAGAIKASADAASQNLGMTKSEYNDLAATMGALLKNKGIKDFAGQTQNLIGLGADLAAQFGGSSKQAVEALASAMRGETDPIEQYGVSMNEAAVQAEALSMGLGKPVKNLDEIRLKQQKAMIAQREYNEAVKTHGKNSDEAVKAESRLMGAQAALGKAMEGKNQKLTDQEKAMAALSLIQKQTTDAQGAAAREQDTYAGRVARLSAAWGDFKATIGGPIIAVLATLMGGLTGVVRGADSLFKSLSGGGSTVSGVRAAFEALAGSPVGQWFADLARQAGGVLGPALADMGAVIKGSLWPALQSLGGVLAGAARAFGGFVAAVVGSPIVQFLVTVLKGALVGFVRGISDIFEGLVKVVSGAFQAVAGLLTGDWSRMWSGLGQVVVGAVQAVWGFLQAGLMGRVLGLFRGFIGAASTIFGGLGAFMSGLFRGLASGFVEFGGTLGRIAGAVIGPAVRAVGAVFGTLKGLADTAISAVVGAFTALGSKITSALRLSDGAMQAFGRGVQAVWSAVSGAVTRAWDLIFGRVLTPMRATLTGVLLAAWTGFQGSVSAVWSAVTGAISTAWSRIVGVFTVMRTWVAATLTGAWTTYRAIVASSWATITAAISNAWAVILARVFTPLRAWVASTLTGAWNTFRSLVAAVWSAISGAISNAWAVILARVFTPLRTWVASTLTGAWTAFRTLVGNVWNAMSTAISNAWSSILSRVFTPLRTWVASTLTSMWNAFRALVAAVWSAMTATISSAWSRILSVFQTLRTWVTSTLTSAWNTLKSIAASAWTSVTTSIGNAWGRISGYFTNLKNGVNQVWSFFQSAVKGISSVWSGLTSAISKPIDAAKSWINSNLIGRMNSTLSSVGVSLRVPGLAAGGVWDGPGKVTRAASGAVLPGYTPGRDPHRFWSPTGGRLALSGGEAVMVPEWTRAVGPRLVKTMNRIARRSGVEGIRKFLWGSPAGKPSTAFARGGVYRRRDLYAGGGVLDPLKGAAGAVGDVIKSGLGKLEGVASSVADVFADPVGAISKLGSSVLNLLPGRNTYPGGLVYGAMGKLVSGAAAKVKAAMSEMLSGGGFSQSGNWPPAVRGRVSPNTAAAVAYGRSAFGIKNIGTLGSRPNRSDHPMGKAADFMIPNWSNPSGISLGNRVASFFLSNPGRFGTKYIIWRKQINKGRGWTRYTHPTGKTGTTLDHWDHVHVSFLNKGGVLGEGSLGARASKGGTRPKLYDNGGMLRRGDIAVHDAAKPDRVLTDAQWKAVMRHLPAPVNPAGARGVAGGGVHIHGDVYGDPERFARRITTDMRDQFALMNVAGVS